MTMIEAGRRADAVRRAPTEPTRTCECLHVNSANRGMSGHEFVALAEAVAACSRDARWNGYWECDDGHLHVTAICAVCRVAHDADAVRGGVQIEWAENDG